MSFSGLLLSVEDGGNYPHWCILRIREDAEWKIRLRIVHWKKNYSTPSTSPAAGGTLTGWRCTDSILGFVDKIQHWKCNRYSTVLTLPMEWTGWMCDSVLLVIQRYGLYRLADPSCGPYTYSTWRAHQIRLSCASFSVINSLHWSCLSCVFHFFDSHTLSEVFFYSLNICSGCALWMWQDSFVLAFSHFVDSLAMQVMSKGIMLVTPAYLPLFWCLVLQISLIFLHLPPELLLLFFCFLFISIWVLDRWMVFGRDSVLLLKLVTVCSPCLKIGWVCKWIHHGIRSLLKIQAYILIIIVKELTFPWKPELKD